MTRPDLPVISVIIPCYNMESTLPLQLLALADQADAPTFEVIVADNRSTDGSRRVAADLAGSVPYDLRVVRAESTQGSSYARNIGIQESRAELLMFCDADDVVSRWWITHGQRNFDHADLWTGLTVGFPDLAQASLAWIRVQIDDSAAWQPPLDEQQTAFPLLMGGNFGATKTALRTIGGFDQSMSFRGDDNDLAFRAQRAGFRIMVSKTARVGYRIKTDSRLIRRITFQSAHAHALLASRYRSWHLSPFPQWALEPLRCTGAALKMLVRPDQRDWPSLKLRTASALGIATGRIRYAVPALQPPPLIGLGWLDVAPQKGPHR